MADLSDLQILFEVRGVGGDFDVKSYYPESEFSISTAAEYSKFLRKLEGLGETVVGDAVKHIKDLEELVNAGRSTFTGKKFWKPAYDTQTFDGNEPFSIILPFIFSTENNSTYDNLVKIAHLSQLTAPVDLKNGTLVLPGPHIGGLDENVFQSNDEQTWRNKLSDVTSAFSKLAQSSYKGERRHHTSVAFQIGNWFRIDNVIVTEVEAKIHPGLDRYNARPIYTECDITVKSAHPPTAQDIQRWFMLPSNSYDVQ